MKFKCNKNIQNLIQKYANPEPTPDYKVIGIVSFSEKNLASAKNRCAAIIEKVQECGCLDIIQGDQYVGTMERVGAKFCQYRPAI